MAALATAMPRAAIGVAAGALGAIAGGMDEDRAGDTCRQFAETLMISMRYGGRGGIRTHEGLTPLAVVKTAALNHSPTLPAQVLRNTHHNKTPRRIRLMVIARMISQPNMTKTNHSGGSSLQNSFAAIHMAMPPPINIRKSGNKPRSPRRRASITAPTANNTTPTSNASHLRSRSFIISGTAVVMPRLFPIPT